MAHLWEDDEAVASWFSENINADGSFKPDSPISRNLRCVEADGVLPFCLSDALLSQLSFLFLRRHVTETGLTETIQQLAEVGFLSGRNAIESGAPELSHGCAPQAARSRALHPMFRK